MDLRLFFTKRKILALILIGILLSLCYIIARRSTIINEPVPLSSVNIEAMFYVENPASGSVTCLGDGIINTSDEISGTNEVASAIVTSPDNTANMGDQLVVIWNRIRHAESGYEVYGTLESAPIESVVTSFSTIDELKSADVSSGDIVSTKGFYSEGDNGGAKYIIGTSALYPVKTNISIALNNGLFANLIFDSSSIIDIQTFGIQANRYIASTLNKIVPTLSGKIDGVKFSNGNYYIEAPILLRSINLYGTDNASIIIDEHYASDFPAAIRTDPNYLNELGLYNLNIIGNINDNFYRKKEIAFLLPKSISKCTIDNCVFEANEDGAISTFIPADLIWFDSNSISNVEIKNTKFRNNTGINYQPGSQIKLHGACIWFSGESLNCQMNNISIHDCDFYTTVADEILAFWKGYYNNISISNCTFTNNKNHISDNYIALYQGAFTGVSINHSNLYINSSTMYPIKFTNFIGQSDFSVNDCNIYLDFATESKPLNHAFAIIYTDADQTIKQDQPVSIVLNNTNFISASDNVYYKTIIQCKATTNKTITLTNCNSNVRIYRKTVDVGANNNVVTQNSSVFEVK